MNNTFGMNTIPDNDNQRVGSLEKYQILNTPAEPAFDHIAALSAKIFQVPIVLITFINKDEVFFKANIGLPGVKSVPRAESICALSILHQNPTVFTQPLSEPFIKDLPLVTGPVQLRFYAGVPIFNKAGYALGTLCLIDRKERTFSSTEEAILQDLATLVSNETEARLTIIQQKQRQDQFKGQLEESEIRFQNLVEQAPIAIAVFQGLSFKVLQANQKMLNLWNKEQDDVLGQPLLTFRPEMHGHPYLNVLHEVFVTGESHASYEIKGPVMIEGHPESYYDVMYQPLKDDKNEVTGVMAMLIDVTEERHGRQREQELNEELITANEELFAINEELTHTSQERLKAEELLRVALDTASIGTWHMDLDTRVFTASSRMNELFGFDAGYKISEQDLIRQIDPAYQEDVKRLAYESVRKGNPYRVEYPIIGFNDQKIKWLLAVGRLYDNPKQQVRHFSGVTMDITEQKQDEIRKNDFIGMVSHELKTPLTSLKGYIQMLHQKAVKKEDEYSSNALGKVEKQIIKMQTLINGFLNLSGLETGKIKLNIKEFDICQLVSDTIEDVKSGSSTAHEFIPEPSEGVMLVRADRDKIGQVIYNFMTNTIKYAPLSKQVNVSCKKVGEHIQVSVKDHGIGIKAADIPKIFDRFFRVDNLHTQHISGFGIGLYLSKEIIQRHHGQIWVESNPGEGTTFFFKLPVSGN